ncbi:MAG: PilZ domain-containing protein [Abditibacteriales bacterium]|nr:PilZ domain-containing protein [Abditibacteriales bacterium]MDW8367586.1 PilZ domain-containing protein [Abditibacteriales bacterium]
MVKERRRFIRVRSDIPVWLCCRHPETGEIEYQAQTTIDISAGGIQILGEGELPPRGMTVELLLDLPDGQIPVQATVKWAREARVFRAGMQFQRKLALRRSIGHYIERTIQRRTEPFLESAGFNNARMSPKKIRSIRKSPKRRRSQ